MASRSINDPLVEEIVTPLNGDRIPVWNSEKNAFSWMSPRTITPFSNHSAPRPFRGKNPIYPISKGRVLDTMESVVFTGGQNHSLFFPTGGAASRYQTDDAFYGRFIVDVTTGVAGPGQYAGVRRIDIGRVLNVEGMWCGMDIDSPDPTAINDITFFLGKCTNIPGGQLTDFYRWNNIIGSQAVRPIQFGKKTRIAFPLATTSPGALGHCSSITNPSGTLSLGAISGWQVRIDGKTGRQANLKIDRIFFFDKPAPAICLSMDDSYRSWFTLGKPIMDELGIRTTLYAIRSYSDDTIPGFVQSGNRLTKAMLKRFVEGGHEIGFHMTGNSSPEDFTPTQVEEEIIAFKKWARNQFGEDVISGAYPGGEQGFFIGPNYPAGHPQAGQAKPGWRAGDELITVQSIYAKHFPLARTIARVSPESDPPADNSLLKCFMYQYGTGPSYTTPAINQGFINTVIQHGGVAIASYHDLVSGVPEVGVTTQYNIDDFRANMEYIASQNIAPLTVREAFTRSLFGG